jgi:CBS domain-containing protein
MINIRDILKEKGGVVYSVSPEATVYECLEKMTAHNVGAVLVMESEKLKGILQERASRSTRVKEIMTANPVCVTLSNSVEEALSIMTKQHCRHLPVIEEGKLAGIVSIGDLVKKKISDMDATIKYLSDYISSEGYH